MSEPCDSILIRRSVGGDPEAFVELIRRHEQPLSALIRREIHNVHLAEDVLQETLLQAWIGLRHLRDASRLRPWLFQVARNRCRDAQRARAGGAEALPEQDLPDTVNRHGRADRSAHPKAEEAVEALEGIPDAEREVAELFYLRGLTIREISQRIHRPEGTIKRRLHYAREHLREALSAPEEPYEEGEQP